MNFCLSIGFTFGTDHTRKCKISNFLCYNVKNQANFLFSENQNKVGV